MTSRPPQRRAVLADPAFREVDQEHFAFVHDATDAHVLLRCGQYAVEQGIGPERPDLVLDRCCAVRPITEREPVEFLQKEPADGLVAQRSRNSRSKLLVREDLQHVVERGAWSAISTLRRICSCDSPRLGPHLLEDIHHAGRSKCDAILPYVAQRIVTERLARIGGVQIDGVAPLRCRDARRDARDEIAVRIDQCEAVAALQVLERHVLQERRFPRAGFADDVNVGKAVFIPDAKDAFVGVKIHAGKTCNVISAHTRIIFLPPEHRREAGGSAGPSVRRIFSHWSISLDREAVGLKSNDYRIHVVGV